MTRMSLLGALAAALVMLPATARPAAAEAAVTTPAAAIEQAIVHRLGAEVRIEITALDTAVKPERRLQARPEPGGRAGQPMRFVMMAGRARRGIAIATVKVFGAYARAARTIGRDEPVEADAVEIVQGELPDIAFKPLPTGGEVIGLVARRDIAAGEALTHAVLRVPPAVRSGDEVVLTVIAGAVRVTAVARASSSGHEGDVIRVVPSGGRSLKARITGEGTVEVQQ